jgi:hypothetical protein
MKVPVVCPRCKHEFSVDARTFTRALGRIKSKARTAAARENGRKGGRPRRNADAPPIPTGDL